MSNIEGVMAESTAAEVQQLIQEGRAAALAGDTFVARNSFRRASELDPSSVEAWLGLSGVVPILAEKRQHLQRALGLDPGNEEARASLAYVERLQSEGMQLAPSRRREERAANGDASPLLSAPEPAQLAVAETLHCYRHPDRETGLRCVQCERPICGACAQITNVGQLCPECRKARRPANYQVSTGHIVVGVLAGLVVGLLMSVAVLFVTRLPLIGLILTFFAGPFTGELAVRAVERLARGKRGRPMQVAVGAGLALGAAPLLLMSLFSLLTLLVVLWAVLAITTAAARLK
ncbi:MAG: hypothetical protein RLZZ387_725 [Chloroflexota bacterium]|jgi:hypothetical protein